MRKTQRIKLLLYLCLCLLPMFHSIAYGYGYEKEEDPLVTVFKSVIFYGRQPDWSKVASEVNTIHDRMEDIQKIFKIDLKPGIELAIKQQDFQSVANRMANLVFLAIREKFYYNREERMEIFIRAKVRLRLAEEYYTALLAGNVRDYDMRHKTNIHEEIYTRFVKARNTLGSIGFLGAGAIKSDEKEFKTLTSEIEALILKTFPYFETGLAYSD